jgi:hypothetical protein
VTAALGAVNAQLRADEQQRTSAGDVLDRLEKLMEQQRKLVPASSSLRFPRLRPPPSKVDRTEIRVTNFSSIKEARRI